MAPLPVRGGLTALAVLALGVRGFCAAEAGAQEPREATVMYVYALDQPAVLMPEAMAHDAYAVLACESRHDPNARNGVSGATGLFQLHPIHARRAQAMGYRWEQIVEPQANVDVATAIWREQGWSPWACKP